MMVVRFHPPTPRPYRSAARAPGPYPGDSGSNPDGGSTQARLHGPFVQWSGSRSFTPGAGVRFPHGLPFVRGSLADLVLRLAEAQESPVQLRGDPPLVVQGSRVVGKSGDCAWLKPRTARFDSEATHRWLIETLPNWKGASFGMRSLPVRVRPSRPLLASRGRYSSGMRAGCDPAKTGSIPVRPPLARRPLTPGGRKDRP
jgi:hypothetical protein